MSVTVALLVLGLLIVANALLSGTEMAFVSLREVQLERLESAGPAGARVVELAARPNRYLAAIQLGITVAGFLTSAIAALALSEPIAARIGSSAGWATTVGVGVTTVGLAFISLVFGELVPKRLAMQRAERWALAGSRGLILLVIVTRPVVALAGSIADLSLRLVGADPEHRRAPFSDDELEALLVSSAAFTAHQRDIIIGAIDAGGRSVREILTPRRQTLWIDGGMTAADAGARLAAARFSRAPVIDGTFDRVVGQVHLRDLIGAAGPVRDLSTSIVAVPETSSILGALHLLQSARSKLALVIDEHGGTEGIVTIEDLVEELVGEIFDDSSAYPGAVQRDHSGTITLPGTFPIHDAPAVGLDLPAGSYVTIAGLVLDRLGHIPEPGELLRVEAYELEVVSVEHHTVGAVRLTWPTHRDNVSVGT